MIYQGIREVQPLMSCAQQIMLERCFFAVNLFFALWTNCLVKSDATSEDMLANSKVSAEKWVIRT